MRTTTIGLLCALCAFTFALGTGEAGKKKPKVPKGVVETLLGPGEWVLANQEGEELTLRSVDQRKVGGAKVARLEWTSKAEWGLGPPPTLIAVTKKGIHLLSEYEANVDDAGLAKLLKKRKPDYKLPLKAGAFQPKGADAKRFVEVRDGNVCVGFYLDGMCGGQGCEAEMCLSSMGLVSVSGAYSPDEMEWTWVAGGLTVAEPAPADPAELAITEFGALRDRACACADTACGEAVMVELDALSQKHAATAATKAQLAALERIGTELGRCVGALR